MYKNLYGSDSVAAFYCGLKKPPRPARGLWMHGWGSVKILRSPLEVFGTAIPKKTTFLFVSNNEFKHYLNEHGYTNVHAIGLPFCYAKQQTPRREPQSLLVIPPHSIPGVNFEKVNLKNYADYIKTITKRFRKIAALIYFYDYDNNTPIKQAMAETNLELIRGAEHPSDNTYNHLFELFSKYEFMTTNFEGSHIAYAASCGMKISISGPFFCWNERNLNDVTFYKNYPEYKSNLMKEDVVQVRSRLGQFFREPTEAIEAESWGKNEIGSDKKVSPRKLKKLFGWDIFGTIQYNFFLKEKCW